MVRGGLGGELGEVLGVVGEGADLLRRPRKVVAVDFEVRRREKGRDPINAAEDLLETLRDLKVAVYT